MEGPMKKILVFVLALMFCAGAVRSWAVVKKKNAKPKSTAVSQKVKPVPSLRVQKSIWDVYIHNHPYTGNVVMINGKVYAEKGGIVHALGLPENASFPGDSIVMDKGKTYVWLPAAVKMTGSSLLVNPQTHIIDVSLVRAGTPGAPRDGAARSVAPGSEQPQSDSTQTDEAGSTENATQRARSTMGGNGRATSEP